MTGGNYHVHRELSYPEFPKSKVVFETDVKSVSDKEWSTNISISGTYDGPTDVVSVKDYRLEWTTDGRALSEKGSATLVLSSGRTIRSLWSSTYTPERPQFDRFPREGEIVDVTFTPFQINGNQMSYDWHGEAKSMEKR